MKPLIFIMLLLSAILLQGQTPPTLDDIIRVLTPPAIPPQASEAISSDETPKPPALPLSPSEHRPYLEALQQLACKEPNEKLTRLMMEYQIAFPNPDNDFPARVLGQLYLEQTATFLQVFETLRRQDKLRLVPYLTFGWDQAVKGKNPSIPRILEKSKRLERLKAALINP